MSGVSFCPSELAAEIKKHIPDFKITYKVDPIKQGIANSWPMRKDDSRARVDWGWKPKFNLERMVT